MRRPAVQLRLRADRRGRVLAVLAGRSAPSPGLTLAPLVADAGAAPLLDFLLALARAGAAWSAELAPAAGGEPLYLAGVAAGDGTLVAGDHDEARLARFCRWLIEAPAGLGEPAPRPEALAELARLVEAVSSEPVEEGVEALQRRVAEQEKEIARLKAALAKRPSPPPLTPTVRVPSPRERGEG